MTVASPARSAHADAARSTSSGVSRTWWIVACLLIVPGLFLRLAGLEFTHFDGEQIELVSLARESLLHGPTTHGVTASIGLDMPPGLIWILSLPVMFTTSPVALAAVVALLNLGGIALVFALVRRAFDARRAWIAVVLLTGAPWAVLFARRVWAPDLVFPLIALFYVLYSSALRRRSPWAVWGACVVLSLAAHVHPNVWFALPAIALHAWIFRARLHARDVVVGLALALVPWVPYVVYQFGVDFDDVKLFWASRASGPATDARALAVVPQVLIGLLQASGAANLSELLMPAPDDPWFSTAFVSAATAITWTYLAVAIAAIAHAVVFGMGRVRAARRGEDVSEEDRLVVLLALVFVGCWVLFSFARSWVTHYATIAFPVVPVLIAWWIPRVASSWFRATPTVAARALLGVGVVVTLAHATLGFAGARLLAERPHLRTGPLLAADRLGFERQLANALDEVEHRAERRAWVQSDLATKFEASGEVLVRFDASRDDPDALVEGFAVERRDVDGLALSFQGEPRLITLPRLAPTDARTLVLRLDVTLPRDRVVQFFSRGPEKRRFDRMRFVDPVVEAGRRAYYVALDASAPVDRVGLRFSNASLILHSVEVRAAR